MHSTKNYWNIPMTLISVNYLAISLHSCLRWVRWNFYRTVTSLCFWFSWTHINTGHITGWLSRFSIINVMSVIENKLEKHTNSQHSVTFNFWGIIFALKVELEITWRATRLNNDFECFETGFTQMRAKSHPTVWSGTCPWYDAFVWV